MIHDVVQELTFRRSLVPPKRLFIQEPHGVTSQKTPFFIVTAVKTSNNVNAISILSVNQLLSY
jgi:hypothetical protein